MPDRDGAHWLTRVVLAALSVMTAVVVAYAVADYVFEYTGSFDRSGLALLTGDRQLPVTVPALVLSGVASTPGLTIATGLVAAWLWWRRHELFGALFLVTAMLVSSLTTVVLKQLVDRPRPLLALQIGPTAIDPAFPSGHTLNSTVFVALVLALVWPGPSSRRFGRGVRIGAWAAAAALLLGIGLSRVYLGYHWPTDVVAGWLVGGVLAAALRRLHRSAVPATTSGVRDGRGMRGAGSSSRAAIPP